MKCTACFGMADCSERLRARRSLNGLARQIRRWFALSIGRHDALLRPEQRGAGLIGGGFGLGCGELRLRGSRLGLGESGVRRAS